MLGAMDHRPDPRPLAALAFFSRRRGKRPFATLVPLRGPALTLLAVRTAPQDYEMYSQNERIFVLFAQVVAIFPVAFYFAAGVDGYSDGCEFNENRENDACRHVQGAGFKGSWCDHGCQCALGYCEGVMGFNGPNGGTRHIPEDDPWGSKYTPAPALDSSACWGNESLPMVYPPRVAGTELPAVTCVTEFGECSDPTVRSYNYYEVGLDSSAVENLGASNCTQWLDIRYPNGTDPIVSKHSKEVVRIGKLIYNKFYQTVFKLLMGATM
jgi:hypothetical protein